MQVTRHDTPPGFPIRKSSDHSPLTGSPRHIADRHVLLRLQMPRHPPFALKRNINSHKSRHSRTRTKSQKPQSTRPTPQHGTGHADARVHYTVLNQRPTAAPTTHTRTADTTTTNGKPDQKARSPRTQQRTPRHHRHETTTAPQKQTP